MTGRSYVTDNKKKKRARPNRGAREMEKHVNRHDGPQYDTDKERRRAVTTGREPPCSLYLLVFFSLFALTSNYDYDYYYKFLIRK